MLKATSAPTVIWSLSTNNAPNAPIPTLMPRSRLVTTLRAPAAVWSSDRLLLAASSVWRRQRSIERGSSAKVLIVAMPLRISNRKALRRPSISLTSLSLLRNVRDIAARDDKGGRRDSQHDQGQLP